MGTKKPPEGGFCRQSATTPELKLILMIHLFGSHIKSVFAYNNRAIYR